MEVRPVREALDEAVFMLDDSALVLSILLGPERMLVVVFRIMKGKYD